MQIGTLPTKFSIPFANAAGPGFIRAIPQASQISIQNGAASLTDGFPPLNFQPVAAGGVPPFGQDMNGILNQISAWVRALSAGLVVPFDAAFQAAIGGYPFKARVLSGATSGLIWESQIDNNLSNPDTGGANWSVPTFIDPGIAGLIVSGGGAGGAGIRLQGTGAAPNKTIRAAGGNFDVVNNAYSSVIFSVTDAGTATANALRAAIGATGSGDSTRVPNLSDFPLSAGGSGYQILPNGFIIQWGTGGATGHLDVVNFPIAFPHACLGMAGSEAGVVGWDTSGTPGRTSVYGFQVLNAAQFYWSCVQIDIYSGPLKISYVADFCKWIAVGY